MTIKLTSPVEVRAVRALLLTAALLVLTGASGSPSWDDQLAAARAEIERSPYGAHVLAWADDRGLRIELDPTATPHLPGADAEVYWDGHVVIYDERALTDLALARVLVAHEVAHLVTWAHCPDVPDPYAHRAVWQIVEVIAHEAAWTYDRWRAEVDPSRRATEWGGDGGYDWVTCEVIS